MAHETVPVPDHIQLDIYAAADLITAALNEALNKVQSMQMGQLAGLAGSIGLGNIPGLAP